MTAGRHVQTVTGSLYAAVIRKQKPHGHFEVMSAPPPVTGSGELTQAARQAASGHACESPQRASGHKLTLRGNRTGPGLLLLPQCRRGADLPDSIFLSLFFFFFVRLTELTEHALTQRIWGEALSTLKPFC